MATSILYPSSNTYPQISFLDIDNNAVSSNGTIIGQVKQEAFFTQISSSQQGAYNYVSYNLTDYPGCSGIIVNASIESSFAGPGLGSNNYMTLNIHHYFVRTIVSGSGASAFTSVFNIDNASQTLTTGQYQENTQTQPSTLYNVNPLFILGGTINYNASNQIVRFQTYLRANTSYHIKGITTFI